MQEINRLISLLGIAIDAAKDRVEKGEALRPFDFDGNEESETSVADLLQGDIDSLAEMSEALAGMLEKHPA